MFFFCFSIENRRRSPTRLPAIPTALELFFFFSVIIFAIRIHGVSHGFKSAISAGSRRREFAFPIRFSCFGFVLIEFFRALNATVSAGCFGTSRNILPAVSMTTLPIRIYIYRENQIRNLKHFLNHVHNRNRDLEENGNGNLTGTYTYLYFSVVKFRKHFF